MKIFRITLVTAWLGLCTAIQGQFDDLPTQCLSVCSSLAGASRVCQKLAGSDDTQPYASCVCDGKGASEAIPLCEACVHAVKVQEHPAQGYREWSANDANRLLRRCDMPLTRTYDLNNPSPTLLVVADTAAAAGATAVPTTDTSNFASHAITSPGASPSSLNDMGATSPAISLSSSSHVSNLAGMPTLGAQGLSFVAGVGLLVAAAIL